MTPTEAKYDALAEAWSDEAYAHPLLFYRRRASLVRTLGGPLATGARILEIGCADGGLSAVLVADGFLVEGIDSSPKMVERARQRVPEGATFAVGDLNDYAPTQPVAATIGFRVLPYAEDLAAFFARVASFSTEKIVFDLVPSTGPTLEAVMTALRRVGLSSFAVQPWLLPARTSVPGPVLPVLGGLERIRPLALAICNRRFSVVVSAPTRGRQATRS
jgi:SAM-dependent methyltransferase